MSSAAGTRSSSRSAASAGRRTVGPLTADVLPANALCVAKRKHLADLQQSVEKQTPHLQDVYSKLRATGYISFNNDDDMKLVEVTSDFLLEVAFSAWAHLSAAKNSVLLDIGAGTCRFAATSILAGVFEKALCVECNAKVARLASIAYAQPTMDSRLRDGIELRQHRFADGKKLTTDQRAADKHMLERADAIFLNNYEFNSLNLRNIVDLINAHAKRGVVLVSIKELPKLDRVTTVVRYKTTFDDTLSALAEKPCEYFVHYFDAYPTLVPPFALPTPLQPEAESNGGASSSPVYDPPPSPDLLPAASTRRQQVEMTADSTESEGGDSPSKRQRSDDGAEETVLALGNVAPAPAPAPEPAAAALFSPADYDF